MSLLVKPNSKWDLIQTFPLSGLVKLEVMLAIMFPNTFSRILIFILSYLRMDSHKTEVKWIDFSLVVVIKHILKQK